MRNSFPYELGLLESGEVLLLLKGCCVGMLLLLMGYMCIPGFNVINLLAAAAQHKQFYIIMYDLRLLFTLKLKVKGYKTL